MNYPYYGEYNQQVQAIQNQIANLQTAAPSWLYNPAQTTSVPKPAMPVQQIQRVKGIDGAKAYLAGMPANSSAILMDNDEDIFYAVQKDANGMASPIMIGHFTMEQENDHADDYVTKKDFEAFKNELKQFLEEKK